MRIALSALLFCLAAVPGRSADYRLVLFLLNTNFALMEKSEFRFASAGPAQRAEVLPTALAMAAGNPYVKVASEASGDIWLGMVVPADAGGLHFISDSRPAFPLLSLGMDAMCGGCAHIMKSYGNVQVNPVPLPQTSRIDISISPHEFLYDQTLDADEVRDIRANLTDSAFQGPADKVFAVRVVKLPHYSRGGGPGQVKYVAWFRETLIPAGLTRAPRKPVRYAASARIDALGRRTVPAAPSRHPGRLWTAAKEGGAPQ